jgi:hypothetical protein
LIPADVRSSFMEAFPNFMADAASPDDDE